MDDKEWDDALQEPGVKPGAESAHLEPNEYFEGLKAKLSTLEMGTLEANRIWLASEIQKAHHIGQTNLTHRSAYLWEVLEKEMVLHAAGFHTYIEKAAVEKFIEKVRPKNSVRIVELQNYPRSIPDENAEAIKKAMDLGIFDLIVIVYTDLTKEEVLTDAQKEFKQRNKDPIAFGMFHNPKINLRHERLYLITDWADEFCDLTFTVMLTRMKELGIEAAPGEIAADTAHINRIVETAKQEVEAINLRDSSRFSPVETRPYKMSFMSAIKSWLGK